VRAGDANPAQLGYWTAAWTELIRDLYAAHAQLMTAWAQAAEPAPRDLASAVGRLPSPRFGVNGQARWLAGTVAAQR
jgi:hypothetical protein